MPAKYVTKLRPFKSIKSQYAGKKFVFICPKCSKQIYLDEAPARYVSCNCGGYFEYY